MNLTQDDLQAIKAIVDSAIDDSDQRTAAGFAEVHEKFAAVDEKFAAIDQKFTHVDERFDALDANVIRIESKLNPTIERVDEHGKQLQALELSPA